MIVAGEYTVEEFFEAMCEDSGRYAYFADGRRFKRDSQRMQLFYRDGYKCVDCGLTGNTFVLESCMPKDAPHLNLYYINEASHERILFTKDHIRPRARGGRDVMPNYQVMCQICNARKGSMLESERTKRTI